MENKQYIEAGKIINTHGVKGEVKIDVWLDSPELLKKAKTIYVENKPVKLVSARVHKGLLIAELEGVCDVNAAMCLKSKPVFINRADLKLPKGAYFIQDILGAEVVTEGGEKVGRLEEVFETPASMIYVVRGEREHLIPAVPEFVLKTDAVNGVITVKLIEGM